MFVSIGTRQFTLKRRYAMATSSEDKPVFIQFTDLLFRCKDPDHPDVEDFLRQHAADDVFQRRAATLITLFIAKRDQSL